MDLGNSFGKKGISSQLLGFDKLVSKYADEEDDLNKHLDDEDLEKDDDAQDFGDISLSDDMEDETEEEKKNEEDLEKKRKEEEERLQNKQRRKEKRELLKAQQLREETELLKSQEAAKSSRFQNLDVTLEVMTKQEFELEDLRKYKSVVSGINCEGKPILKFSEIFLGKKEYQYPVAPKSVAFVSKKHKMKKQLADEKLFLSTVSFGSDAHIEDTDSKPHLDHTHHSTTHTLTEKIFENNKDVLTFKPPMGFPLEETNQVMDQSVDMVDEKEEGEKGDKDKGEEEASSEYIEEVSNNPIDEFLSKNENEIGSVDFNMWEMNIQWGDKEQSSEQSMSLPPNSSFIPNIRLPTTTTNPKHFGTMSTTAPPKNNVPSKNTDSKTTLHRPTNATKKPNEKFLTKKKTVNDDVHSGDWLHSVVWDETSPPVTPVNTKLILDLNDVQVNMVQFDKERLQSEFKKQEREEFYKRKEVEDVERLLEEEMEANAPAETKRKRGRPPTKKDPEMIKANNKMIQSSKLEVKKKELFEKRSKLRKLIPVNDPWNISKDSEYLANFGSDQKSEENAKLKKIFIQHSLPTQNIEVFKTHFTPKELDNFHKPKFDIEPNDHFSLCWTKPPPENDDDNFFVLRRLKDMSGLQNNVAVVEYLEEWPLLMNNVGMEMKLQTFYRKKSEDENVSADDPKVNGELVTLDPNEDSPFYGQIPPGVHIPTFNSNLFRAPVGSHKMKETDFLIVFQKELVEPQNIQCSNTLPKVASVRPLDRVHTVGQQQPLCKVPPPGKRPYNNYIKNRLQHHIFRLFKDPTRKFQIQISDIMDAYPAIAETAVRNRLKFCFFVRATGHWILNPGLILPDEQEMRNIVKPEHICAFESCLSGQRRLEQIGIQKVQNIRDFPKAFAKIKNDQRRTGDFMMLEQEILRAPWSITTDYFEAITENKKMRVTGIGDPSQVGDMCSFLKAPLRPDKPTANSKGRKRKIDHDVVEDVNNDFIFDDGSDFKYRQQIDQVFLRNAQLVVDPNPDIRVYDENESSDDESDLDKLGQDIENLLDDREEHLTKALQRSIIETTKTNSSYVPKRKKKTEEEERDYQKIMLSIQVKEELKENGIDPESEEGKRIISERVGHHKDVSHDTIWIKLTKKEENVDGSVKQVIQIVKDPKIVEQYRKKLKKPSLGRAQKKVTAPTTLKEEAEQANVKRAKRKLQEKLRRLKRIQETQKENAAKLIKAYQQGIDPSAPTDDGLLRCAACGLAGHMKTNRKCPLFVAKDELPTTPVVTPSTDKKNLVIRFKTNELSTPAPTPTTNSTKKSTVKKEATTSTTKKTPAKKKTKKNIDFSDEDY